MNVKIFNIFVIILICGLIVFAVFNSPQIIEISKSNNILKFLAAGTEGSCGNGILEEELGERCDDGNLISGDGCDASCEIENVKVLELLFNEGSGTILNDSSGFENNLNIVGAEWIKLPTNKWALKFKEGDHGYCNYSSSLDISGTDAKLTLETWVNISENNSTIWMGNGMGAIWGGYDLYFYQPINRVAGFLDGKVDEEETGWKALAYTYNTNTIEKNHWYHVVYTYDGQYGRIYLNGNFGSQSREWTGGIFSSDAGFQIRKGFLGMFGKISVYNYVLSENEIKNIYDTELSSYQSTSSATTYVYPAITDQKILPDTIISNQYISNNISIDGSPGEYRSASFVITPYSDISSMTVTASNLTGSNNTINSNSVNIRVVKTWYQAGGTIYVQDNKQKILTPELLLKDDSLIKVENQENYLKLTTGEYVWISEISEKTKQIIPVNDMPVKDSDSLLPVNISSGTNKQFWITLKIPENTPAGTYNGTINLNTPQGQIGSLNIQVKVHPIQLLEPNIEHSIYYRGLLNSDWPQGSISSEIKSETQMRAELKNMFDHGVLNPSIYQGGSLLGKVVDMRKSIGINGPIYWLNINYTVWGTNPETIKKGAEALLEKYGINELYIYGKDEAIPTDIDKIQIEAVKEGGVKVFNAQNKSQELFADVYNTMISSMSLSKSLADKVHSYGNKIYSYGNPQVGLERPEIYRRNYGLALWQNDYDGSMNYAYQAMFGSVWNDFDGIDYRDHNFTYPTIDGVIDTIQWEGFREGVNDMRYLATLLNTIKNAKAGGKDTSLAENWLANLKNLDLIASNLDDVRSNMINHILTLQEGIQNQAPEQCSNECSESGIKKCYDATRLQTCGSYDTDPCLEWSAPQTCQGSTSCGYGTCTDLQKPTWSCKDGKCVYTCNTDSSCKKVVTYVQNYKKACYDNDIYWFDSKNVKQSIFKDCGNDICSKGECIPSNSIEYCQGDTHCGDNICNCQEDTLTCSEDCEPTNLAVVLYANDKNIQEWRNEAILKSEEEIEFMLIVKNNTSRDVDNIVVKTDLPEEIAYSGDLIVNNISFDGNIVSGINIGFIPANSEKRITFKGKVLSGVSVNTNIQLKATVATEDASVYNLMPININQSKSFLKTLGDKVVEHPIWAIMFVVIVSILSLIGLYFVYMKFGTQTDNFNE